MVITHRPGWNHLASIASLLIYFSHKTRVVRMNTISWFQFPLYVIVLLLLVKPLGLYMARVYQGEITILSRIFLPVEKIFYRLSGIQADEEMDWKTYASTLLLFNLIGLLFLYLLLRLQYFLPLNPQALGNVPPDLAFNTAVSFVTNTNWQSYGGEYSLSYLSQMLGLGVQNFLSAATGMAVLAALVRGIDRHTSGKLGNFWVDLVRSTLYILFPACPDSIHIACGPGCGANVSSVHHGPGIGPNHRFPDFR